MVKKNVAVNVKPEYSKLIGLWKTIENGAIWLVPLGISLLVHADEWLPASIHKEYALAISAIIYFLRNWQKNKN